MDDKEFKKWNKAQKMKKRKKPIEIKYKIITKKKGNWNLPENF